MITIRSIFAIADRALGAAERTAAVILGLAVAALMVLEVITRYVFGAPWFGLEEVTLICVMWLYMIGASLACRERSHLRADLIHLVVTNPIVLKLIRSLTTLISLIMAIYIMRWSFDLVAWGMTKGQATPVFRIPWVVSQSSLLVGAVFFTLYLLRDLIEDVRAAVEQIRSSRSKEVES